MTVQEQIAPTRSAADTAAARRARFHCPENGFSFAWPAVPAHQFLAERDRAMDPATPTSTIELDIAQALGTRYPATTPSLLTRYIKIRGGEAIRSAWAASGEIYYVMKGAGESRNASDIIQWGAGDAFCFPGGGETVHRAGEGDCLLFCATDEPLLAFAVCGLRRRNRRDSKRRTGVSRRSTGSSNRCGSVPSPTIRPGTRCSS
jgi:hypothetical protein